MTSVLIVDQQALHRLCFRMLMESQPDMSVIGETADGAEAVRLTDELRPDIVLLDILTDTAGLEAARLIARSRNRTRVLVVSPRDDAHAFPALRAGAAGLLPADVLPDELLAGIRMVAAGGAVIPPALTRRLVDAVRRQRPFGPSDQDARLQRLTTRERDVLVAIASGLSSAEMAERMCIAPTTVKSHTQRMLTKIGAHTRTQAVVFAYETGLVRPFRRRSGPFGG